MAYSPVTPTQFKERFPEFADVPNARVQAVLDEAERWADDTWNETDRATAVKYVTAHLLISEGALSSDQSVPAAGVGPVRSEKLGDAQVTYGDAGLGDGGGGGSSISGMDRTAYGRQYLVLLRRNRAGPRVV